MLRPYARIYAVKRAAKLLLLVLALAALPLRGIAGLAMVFCDSHHGAGVATQDAHHGTHGGEAHDGAEPKHHDTGGGGPASVCSLCAACCVGSSAAPDGGNILGAMPQPALRIPFHGDPIAAVFSKQLDRPPLSPLR